MAKVEYVKQGPAEKLFRLGYTDLVSVARKGKAPAVWALGKWAGYSWNDEVDVLFAGAMDRDGANIGLRARLFPGLDIDSDDQWLTDRVLTFAEETLGKGPLRRSTGTRRLMAFRLVGVPFKKKKLTITLAGGGQHAVEMLADGQQYVIYGEHPTGSRYGFVGGRTLPKDPHDLPRISEDDVDRFFDLLADALRADGHECSMTTAKAGERVVIPDEISEGERSDQLIRLAGSMRRQGADYDTILAALTSMNESRCNPPMYSIHVDAIARSGMRYDASPDALPTKPGDVFEPQTPTFKRAYKRVGADEAMAKDFEEIEWLLDGWIPAVPGYTLLNSKPKVGKSTFARALAVAVSNGTDFLGLKTKQGPVLYVTFPFEGDERRTAAKLEKLGQQAPEMSISGEWVKGLTREDVIATIAADCVELKPRLIVVDTVMKLLRMKDGNDYNEIQKVLEPLYHVLEPYGTHFLFVHHDKKGGVDDVVESGLGSIGLAGNAETVIRIQRDEELRKVRVIDGVGRDAGDIDPQILGMDAETEEPYLDGTLQKYKDRELQREILACLGELEEPEPMTSEDIRMSIGKRRVDVERVLKSCDAVVKSGKGIKGDPVKWALTNPHDVFTPEEVGGPDGDGGSELEGVREGAGGGDAD